MKKITTRHSRLCLLSFALACIASGTAAYAQVAPSTPTIQCSSSGTQATISWGAVANATAYAPRLNYQANDGPSCVDNWLCSGDSRDWVSDTHTSTSYVTNVEAGQPYAFWVHAIVDGSFGAASSASFTCNAAPPPAPPSAPSNLAPSGPVAAGSTSVQLSWNHDPSVTEYYVRANDQTDGAIRFPGNNCPTSPHYFCIDRISGNSISMPVTPGRAYSWFMNACNAAGCSSVQWANFTVPVVTVVPLTTPTNLTTTCSADARQVTFAWNNVAGASWYAPRFHDLAVTWFTAPNDWMSDAHMTTSYTANIAPNKSYSFWVHAGRAGEWSDAAANWAVSCVPVALPPLATPTNLTTTCSADATKVTFSWGAVSGAEAYAPRLDYLDDAGWLKSPQDWYSQSYPSTSYTATITAGKPYAFWVHARRGPETDGASYSGYAINQSFSCVPLPPSGGNLISNGGFETPVTSDYQYLAWSGMDASIPGWSLSGPNVAIQRNSAAWSVANAPEGSQTIVLQNYGTISTTINVPATGSYLLAFKAAARQAGGAQTVAVRVNGGAAVYTLSSIPTSFTQFQTTLNLAVGAQTITFAGLNGAGDNTAFIDDVQLAGGAAPEPTGSLTTNSPCAIESGQSSCSVTYQWTATNAPTVCLWMPDSVALLTCGGATATGSLAGVTSTITPIEVRAHASTPDGSPASFASSKLLYTTSVVANCAGPIFVSAMPQTLARGSSSFVNLHASPCSTASWQLASASGPMPQSTGVATAVGPFLQAGTYTYQFQSVPIVVTVVEPSGPAPTLIEATTFTANCIDKYCIKLTGFNFAPNSIVQVRRGEDLLGTLLPSVRGRNGDADTMEVTLPAVYGLTPVVIGSEVVRVPVLQSAMHSAINGGSPPFTVSVVNPLGPTDALVRKQVLRNTGTVAGAVLSYQAPSGVTYISATFLKGWACRTNATPLHMSVRLGSIDGPQVMAGIANEVGPAIAGGAPCGADGKNYFNFRWPDFYRDGKTRQFYVVAEIGRNIHAIPGNILIGNSPLTVTLPAEPLRAQVMAFEAPAQMTAGSVYDIGVSLQNIGSVPWTAADGYKLGLLTDATNATWGLTRVALPFVTISPGQHAVFRFSVRAPTTAGRYAMQWQLLREGVQWFGDPTSAHAVTVDATSPPVIPVLETALSPIMLAGQSYPVRITYKNTSNTTWTTNQVSLRQTSPSLTWFATNSGSSLSSTANLASLPRDVPPGGTVTFAFSVVAPGTRGYFTLGWQLYEAGQPLLFTEASRDLAVVVLSDVTPKSPPPPVTIRPFPDAPD